MAYKILYFLPGGQDSIGVIPGSYKKQSIAIKTLVSWNELVPEPINSCLILGARKYVVILQLRVQQPLAVVVTLLLRHHSACSSILLKKICSCRGTFCFFKTKTTWQDFIARIIIPQQFGRAN